METFCISFYYNFNYKSIIFGTLSGRGPGGDADAFKVGDRVKASGKRGVIAFIGETQFAGGEWAGIVLDEPVGKNDGTINGVRYFQTDEKKGVFIRPAKLEFDSPTPPPSTSASYTTPAATSPPLPKSTSRSSIKSSDTQPLPAATEKSFKVGESVVYNGKCGVVKFVGPTEFKEG